MVQELARQQVRTGHDVQLVSTAWRGVQGVSLEEGVRVLRLPAIHWTEHYGVPYPLPTRGLPRSVARELAAADVHHAHGCLYRTTRLAARLASKFARPLIVTEHVGFVPYPQRPLEIVERLAWRWVGDRTLSQADAVVALNERVRHWVRSRIPGKQVELIPNGVDLETFRPATSTEKAARREALGLPQDAVLGAFVGREVAKKNLQALLDRPRKDFRLVCCGSTRRMPDDIYNLGIVDHSQMPTLYQAVDFFIHIGVGEGFPVAIQEAGACGVPLLLLWDEGYDGVLSREDALTIDTLDELSDACSTMALKEDLRRELGSRLRRRAEELWTWERTRRSYDEVYERVSSPDRQ